MSLIDADALKLDVLQTEVAFGNTWVGYILKEIRSIVDEAPTVDIVRCKDCKHYRTRWYGFCDLIGNENIHREDDDFCSYGERKTADEVTE